MIVVACYPLQPCVQHSPRRVAQRMAHPWLDHHLVESLLLHAFKPSPEVLRKPVSKFIVAPNRLGEALQRLVDAGLDLAPPPSVTPANALGSRCWCLCSCGDSESSQLRLQSRSVPWRRRFRFGGTGIDYHVY